MLDWIIDVGFVKLMSKDLVFVVVVVAFAAEDRGTGPADSAAAGPIISPICKKRLLISIIFKLIVTIKFVKWYHQAGFLNLKLP